MSIFNHPIQAFQRIAAGVDPWRALTTSAPKASTNNTMGQGTYAPYGGTVNAQGYNPGIPDPAAHAVALNRAGLVQGAFTSNAGGAGGGGGGGGAYDPNTDAAMLGQARGLITGDQNTLNGLYNSLNPRLASYANDARGRIDTQFGQQQTANDKSLANGVAGINGNYGSRGSFDSSYRGNDISTANDAYKQSNDDIMNQKNQGYAQIGQTVAGVQSQLNDKPQYDLSQYKDVNSLTQLHNQLGQHIASLRQTEQQLAPQGELIQKLNSVAAPVSNLDGTIKGQLDGLIKANTPSEALLPLATAYLTRAGITDPAKQKNYFDYLNTLKAPTPTANNLALQGA